MILNNNKKKSVNPRKTQDPNSYSRAVYNRIKTLMLKSATTHHITQALGGWHNQDGTWGETDNLSNQEKGHLKTKT